jgi:hypothetical protein
MGGGGSVMIRGPRVHLGCYITQKTIHIWCCSNFRVISLWVLSPLAGVIRVRVSHLYI